MRTYRSLESLGFQRARFTRVSVLPIRATAQSLSTVVPVYEWIPTTIVAGTFLIGLVSESIEARRFADLRSRLGRRVR